LVKAVVENLENDKVKIDIEVDASEFEKTVEKAYLKNRGAIAIPGFRKGKAPRKIIERFYGEGVFHEDAFEMLFPKAYYKAISENGLKPADEPSDIDMVQIGSGQNLKFSLKVQLEPKPELGAYKGVEVVKVPDEVTEEDIANELNRLAEEHARWLAKDDGAALEDRVSVSVACYVDDELVEAIAPKKQLLPLGSDIYLPGFDAELIGMKTGEQKQFEYTLSDDYAISDYAGKSVTFHVTMDEIKYRELPELDDEFAKDVSEYDTLAELKDSIRIRLEKEKSEHAKNENLSRLLSKINDSAKVDIPDNMIDDRVESMLHESEHRTQALFGKTLKELDEIKYISLDEMKANYKQQAYIDIKNELILDEIAKKEMLLATEDEIEAKLPKGFSSGWKSFELDNNKEINILENLKDAITRKKVMEYLLENAVFVEENTIDSEKSAEGEVDLHCAVETEV
jgi:trigger factor